MESSFWTCSPAPSQQIACNSSRTPPPGRSDSCSPWDANRNLPSYCTMSSASAHGEVATPPASPSSVAPSSHKQVFNSKTGLITVATPVETVSLLIVQASSASKGGSWTHVAWCPLVSPMFERIFLVCKYHP